MKTINSRIISKHDTTANWGKVPSFIPLKGEIIIYEDYRTTEEGVNIPGIKVGDGNAYIVDLPFVSDNVRDDLLEHIKNTTVHITAEERSFWNAKLNCEINNDILIFNNN